MQEIQTIAEFRCFGGVQGFYEQTSRSIGLPMRFGVYVLASAEKGRCRVLYCLAGLTCDEQTFAIKAGVQQHAAAHGLALVAPDRSPRNTGIAEAGGEWDFRTAAGFYLDTTREPFASRWQMETWIIDELPEVLSKHFPVEPGDAGLLGHSMGGHGALTLAFKKPSLLRSVSVFASICAPSQVPWGCKAFEGYFDKDEAVWSKHDAVQLIAGGARAPLILMDQGLSDEFLHEQLRPDLVQQICGDVGQPLLPRQHAGYGHGYYFISSFINDHIVYHARP